MFSEELKTKIEKSLEQKFQKRIKISGIFPVSGGCINECYNIKTNETEFFVKTNNAKKYPGMFEAECKGLKLLQLTNTHQIPEVIFCGEENEISFLILEFVKSGKRQKNFFEDFGKKLAILHKYSSEKFGLEYDNYIGSLKQCNNQSNNWVDFFIRERMEKQIELARNNNKIDYSTILQFQTLYNKLNEIFPEEKPSLLHGDLWSGNYIIAPDGFACILDPAVYYGFREMDIAMTKLFGGFPHEFYDSYNSEFPMGKGWEERMNVCNLYPLMVHVNLFGGGYLQQVKSILKRF